LLKLEAGFCTFQIQPTRKEADMNLLQIIKKNPVFKDTLIEDLFQMMTYKNFIDRSDPIHPEEESVGEMNDLEKSLASLAVIYQEEQDYLIAAIEKGDLDQEEEFRLANKLYGYQRKLEMATSFLDESIRKNFSKHAASNVKGWELRSGFKVVPMKTLHIHIPEKRTGLIDMRGGEA